MDCPPPTVCTNGQCMNPCDAANPCNPLNCERCVDGYCESLCGAGYACENGSCVPDLPPPPDPECDDSSDCDADNCETCQSNECRSSCDSENCESCIDGSCQVCGGDPNSACCGGSCCDSDVNCQSCVNGECKVCQGNPYQFCCNETCCTCPTINASVVETKCGVEYGALIMYCFECCDGSGIPVGGWSWEEVTSVMGCRGGSIVSTPYPFEITNGFWIDMIVNNNGPPGRVAPCQDLTSQTIYWGPTLEKVKDCSFSNEQKIDVQVWPNKVETSSMGAVGSCSYSFP